MADTIFVKARPELGGRTALWEKHADHPTGEVFVQGDDVVAVARTAAVMERLAPSLTNGGTLVRLEGAQLDEALEAQKLRQEQRRTVQGAAQARAVQDTRKADELEAQNVALRERIDELEAGLAQRIADAVAAIAPAPAAPLELTGEGVRTPPEVAAQAQADAQTTTSPTSTEDPSTAAPAAPARGASQPRGSR